MSRKISDISRAKLKVMDETTLDTQTVEYYTRLEWPVYE